MKFRIGVVLTIVTILAGCESASSQSLGNGTGAATDVNVVNTPGVSVTNESLAVTIESDEAIPVTVRAVGNSLRTPFRSSAECAAIEGEDTCMGTFLLDGVSGTFITEGTLVIEQVGVFSPHNHTPGTSEPFDFWLAVNYNDGLGSLRQRLSIPELRGRRYVGTQQVRIYHDVASGESVQFGYIREEPSGGIAKVNMSISGYVIPPGNIGLGP